MMNFDACSSRIAGVGRQQETIMPKDTAPNFEVPAEMRAFAEQSVEQAKLAFDKFMSAANDALHTMEGQAKTAQAGAKDVRSKAMSYAEDNVNSAFEFAQRVVRAKDVNDLMQIQAEFVKEQMQTMSDQAKAIGETATKHAMSAGKSASS
jgi:phasin